MLKNYIGCKIVSAEKMTLGEYNKLKGLTGKKDDTEGYIVLYPDGYSSWCPESTFEATYRDLSDDETKLVFGVRKNSPLEDDSTFTFGVAIPMLYSGKKVARKSWKNAYLFIPKDLSFESDQNLDDLTDEVVIKPCIGKKSEDGSIIIGWAASQEDVMAEDWYAING